MKIIEIKGKNYFDSYREIRKACRTVIIKDDMLLLSFQKNRDTYMLPGGGLEINETEKECAIREVEEETGYAVMPVRKFLILYEYYEEYCYISHYFVCKITGLGMINLTEAEKERGLEPQWIPFNEAIDLFSHHQDYAKISEEKRGSYLREYTALKNLRLSE